MIGGLEEPFGDGTHIVYVDAEHAGEDTELGHLMHDFACTDPEEMHYDVLREEARRLKGAKEGREEKDEQRIREGGQGDNGGLEEGMGAQGREARRKAR